jgi:Fe-Mn family superoxide dismutase
MNRRRFLQLSIHAGLLAFLQTLPTGCDKRPPEVAALSDLPYAPDALAPHISARTIGLHHGRHHFGYVQRTNRLAAGTAFGTLPLTAIIAQTAGDERHAELFNNAAQAYNHECYWASLRPGGGGAPDGAMRQRIDNAFGNYRRFRSALIAAAVDQFGSGWAWLVLDGDRLRVVSTADADTPLAHGLTPLLTIDVWEHAYYLDYEHRRGDYVTAVVDHLLNWEFAEAQLRQRKGGEI